VGRSAEDFSVIFNEKTKTQGKSLKTQEKTQNSRKKLKTQEKKLIFSALLGSL